MILFVQISVFMLEFYNFCKFLCESVRNEVTKHKGGLDLIAESDDFIYLMGFKLDETAAKAIERINPEYSVQKYAAAYLNSTKKIFLVGG
jgi:hypothetical protein